MIQIFITKEIFTSIDDEDFDLVTQYFWVVNTNGYVVCDKLSMHRLITNVPEKIAIDHIDHNRLNNQKSNLRFANSLLNGQNKSLSSKNKSGFCGVSWHKGRNQWQAMIKVKFKQIFLGNFNKLEDAIAARKIANIRYKFHANHGLALPTLKKVSDNVYFQEDRDLYLKNKTHSSTKHKFIYKDVDGNYTRYKVAFSCGYKSGKTWNAGSFSDLESAIIFRDNILKGIF